jgi:copper chaperone CopZ
MRTLACLLLSAELMFAAIPRHACADSERTQAGVEKVYVLGIEGMTCEKSCPQAVKKSIESLPGVRRVEVSFEDKRAVVHTDPGVELTTHQLDLSFHNQGYFVSSLEVKDGE